MQEKERTTQKRAREEEDALVAATLPEELRALKAEDIEAKFGSADRGKLLDTLAQLLTGYQSLYTLHTNILLAERAVTADITKLVSPPVIVKAPKEAKRVRGVDNACAMSTKELGNTLQDQADEDRTKEAAAALKRKEQAEKRTERQQAAQEKENVKRALLALGFITDPQSSWRSITVEAYRAFLRKQQPGYPFSGADGVKKGKADLLSEMTALVAERLATKLDFFDHAGVAVSSDELRTKWAQSELPAGADGEGEGDAAEVEMEEA